MSPTRSWFLNSRNGTWGSGAFIEALLSIEASRRHEHCAFSDLAMVHGRKHAVDVVERVLFDKRVDRDLAVEHQIQRSGIELGRAAPVADGARIEGHQVRQAQFDLI